MNLYHHPLSGTRTARISSPLYSVHGTNWSSSTSCPAHKRKPDLLALNLFGQVPVLDDDGTIVAVSNRILVYLAKKSGRAEWLPKDAKGSAAVQRWLSVAAGEVA